MGLTIDFNKLQSKIDELSKSVNADKLNTCLNEGEEITIKSIKNNTPVDTSELKNHVGKIKQVGSGLKAKRIIGINSNNRKVVERGYYQEYGTCCISGKHWMKKGFNQANSQASEAIKKSLKELFKV